MQSLMVAEAHCGKSWVHSIFQEFCHRWLSFLRWVFCSPGWAGTHYVSENDLELIIDIDIYITLIPPLSARIISMHHQLSMQCWESNSRLYMCKTCTLLSYTSSLKFSFLIWPGSHHMERCRPLLGWVIAPLNTLTQYIQRSAFLKIVNWPKELALTW